MAVWSFIVEYLDLYWIVMPVHYKTGPQLHWLDFATLAATVSICGFGFLGTFSNGTSWYGGRSALPNRACARERVRNCDMV